MFLFHILFLLGQWGMGPGPGTAHSAGAACGTYTHYRVITVPAQSALSGNLSNYPLLVSGTYSYLATVANGGLVQNASGFDVGFFTDNTCTTKLPWETETYSATAGTVNYWVQVPTISQSASITFVMAYDNAAITTDQSNKTGTWNSNFFGVYHLADGTTLNQNDSTTNANNTSLTGSGVASTGQIDGAVNFAAGGAALQKTSPANQPLANTPRSLSAWIFSTNLSGAHAIDFIGTDTGTPTAYVILTSGAHISAGMGGAGDVTGTTTLSTSTWYYVVATYSGSTNLVYVNGVLDGTLSYSGANTGLGTLGIGAFGTGTTISYVGKIDEARFSKVVLSADWIKTDYNSQLSPSTFYSVGSQF